MRSNPGIQYDFPKIEATPIKIQTRDSDYYSQDIYAKNARPAPPAMDPALLANIENVMDFFDDPDRYNARLENLEQLLKEKAQEKDLLAFDNGTYRLRANLDETKGFKLLSTVLEAFALSNRFRGIHKIGKHSKILNNSEFQNILINQKLIKDPGAYPVHGAWEHAIQWFCLISEFNHNPNFLSVSPIELYQQMGEFGQKDGGAIWLTLFEFRNYLPFARFLSDTFSRPHDLSEKSLSNVFSLFTEIQSNPKLPLLTELMRRRTEKQKKDPEDKTSLFYILNSLLNDKNSRLNDKNSRIYGLQNGHKYNPSFFGKRIIEPLSDYGELKKMASH